MEESDELDGILWTLVSFLDPDDSGEVTGEPWLDPEFDVLIDRLSRALVITSAVEPEVGVLLARSALLSRAMGLVSGMVSSSGELVGRLSSLSRLINAPYSQIPPAPVKAPSGLSKRI